MKLYYISPIIELYGSDDERSQQCISLISNLVCDSLRQNGDHFHFTVDWRDPGNGHEIGFYSEDIAEPHIIDLRNAEFLMERVRQSVDPSVVGGGTIRSIATCRAVTFGYDGQAFICLRHEDTTPVSPDPSLVAVEERLDILLETDYLDGWLRPNEATL